MYNRYAKEVEKTTNAREVQFLQEPIRSQVLERWRKLGFTKGLQECFGELEFMMASSFEMMAIYLLDLPKDESYPGDWEEAFFPLLGRVLHNFWGKHKKACRAIEPEEVISFLIEKDIYDLLKFMYSPACKNRSIHRRDTYETLVATIRNYCEVNGFKYSLLNAYVQIKKSDEGEKFGKIFLPGEFANAVFLYYVADYFLHELYEFDKLHNNRKRKNKNA